MATCSNCHGRGTTHNPVWHEDNPCSVCRGTGKIPDPVDVTEQRWRAAGQQAGKRPGPFARLDPNPEPPNPALSLWLIILIDGDEKDLWECWPEDTPHEFLRARMEHYARDRSPKDFRVKAQRWQPTGRGGDCVEQLPDLWGMRK